MTRDILTVFKNSRRVINGASNVKTKLGQLQQQKILPVSDPAPLICNYKTGRDLIYDGAALAKAADKECNLHVSRNM